MRVAILSFFVLLLSGLGKTVLAQESDLNSRLIKIEGELSEIISSVSNSTDFDEQIKFNNNLILLLEEALELEGAMNYPFDKLSSISNLSTSSNSFRIFTWELNDSEDIAKYFGVVAYESEGSVEVEILTEAGQDETLSEYKTVGANNWYGAIYYDILEVDNKKNNHVVLLGINRNEVLIKKKFIESAFIDGKLKFGKEVFEVEGNTKLKRKIYKYSADSDMSIVFEKEDDLIVLDHLSPEKPVYEGKFEFYVPDLSFDAFELTKGRWIYKADYDARLDKNLKDRYFEMELKEEKKVY